MSVIEKIRNYADRKHFNRMLREAAHKLLTMYQTIDETRFKAVAIKEVITWLSKSNPELIDELYHEIFGDKE